MGVKYETIKKATQRAEKAGKKFVLLGIIYHTLIILTVSVAAAIAVICFAERKLAKK